MQVEIGQRRRFMKNAETNEISRRRFAIAGLSAGAAMLTPGALFAEGVQPLSGKARSGDLATITPVSNASFHPLKQIGAGLLNVGYAEDGPADGPPVMLLHGWPYDIYSFVDVAPLLASKGYRVIVPFLRGYGTTRFLSSDTFQWPAIRSGPRHHQSHGCAQDSEGDPCRF